ncbi:hypothetical protein [Kribbella monticola]|uniref:hypothetical protein n=1 Tax=Kribbella monticola TaxID=2185285 RepID=UPI000DD331DE|nr:hypothetical protein [Kribbella monticola]
MSLAKPAGRSPLVTSPWMTLCPLGTVEIDVRSGDVVLAALEPDRPVVLVDQRPFSRRRLRRLARRLALEIEHEFIVLPTLRRPIVLVDDTEPSVRHFWTTIATVPPGLAFSVLPASALIGLARRLPWSWTGAAAPGRALLGRRP